MKKISRRSFMIASGKAMGAMTVAAAFACLLYTSDAADE